MRFKEAALAAGMAAVVLVGCNSSDSGAPAGGSGATAPAGGTASTGGKKDLTIAVIPKGSTHEFWKSVNAGAQAAGKELGVKIQFKGPLKEDDKVDQIKTVEDFTTAKVDGIVLAPLDDQALTKPVHEAVGQTIPVVIIDSALKSDEFSSFVATDNEKGGAMAGEQMVKLLGDKGDIIVLRYQKGSASTDAREKGFLDVIAKHPGIKVLSANEEAGPTVDSAQKKAESLLGAWKNPDGSLKAQGIYTPNESSTFGMLRVLEENKWAGKVKFVGFDSAPKLIDGLTSGEIDALVVQNPYNMGYLSVKTIVDVINKKPVEKRVDTGATLVTKDNMKDEKIAKLLNPPKE